MAELNELLFSMLELDTSKRLVSMTMVKYELQRIAGMQRALVSASRNAHASQIPPASTWQIDKSSVLDANKNIVPATGSGQAMQMQFAAPMQQFAPPAFSAPPLFSNRYATASLIFSGIGIALPMYFSFCSVAVLTFDPGRFSFNLLFLLPALLGIIFGRIGMRYAKKLHPVLLPGFRNARNGFRLGLCAFAFYISLYALIYILAFSRLPH